MADEIRDGGPAFPRTGEGFGNPKYDAAGMSLRDWFAGHVACGMVAYSGTMGISHGAGQIAERSYEIADAMLAARTPETEG